MASARELLEQADALMRRNRGRSDAADIPVLTDVVTATATAPLLPAEVPVLTDVVEEVVVDILPLPAETSRSSAAFEGNPSDWLVMDTVDPAMHGITGRPPDTLSAVPAFTLKAVGSAATPPPEGSYQRGLREAAPPQKPDGAEQHTTDEAIAPPRPEADEQPAFRVLAPSEKAERDDQASEPPTPQPLGEDVGLRDSPLQLHWPREEFGPAPDGSQLPAEETARQPPSEDESRLGGHTGGSSSESPPQPPRDQIPLTSVVSSEGKQDDERWRALAEQISMQVLQRIDLFTDTGLKEQLAAHLQPIVERAGAELVSAINDHVGRLLRAYVAEAIEREIAQWRDSQR